MEIVVSIIVVLAILITIMSLTSKNENGLPKLFGYYIQTVESESMSGTFEKGDIIISKAVKADEIKVNDVISFKSLYQNQPIIITHRVIEIEKNESGITLFTTWGDNKKVATAPDENIPEGDVIARYTGKKIPGMGKVSNYVKTKHGFLICVLIPLFLFLFWQLYSFIITLVKIRQTNYREDVEAHAKLIAAEMLKQMQAENNPPTATPTEEQPAPQEPSDDNTDSI